MIGRIGRWAARRIGAEEGGGAHAGATAMRSGFRRLRIERTRRPIGELLTEGPADPKAEFSRLLDGAGGGDPSLQARNWRRQAAAYPAGGILIVAAIALFGLPGGPVLLTGTAMSVLPACLLLALRADFLAWRCERRSWDAPVEYLCRLPGIAFR